MVTVMQSVSLSEFGIAGIRIGFYGKFNGNDRAYRYNRLLGANPCLRNFHLVGSYSNKQIKSRYGITNLHI